MKSQILKKKKNIVVFYIQKKPFLIVNIKKIIFQNIFLEFWKEILDCTLERQLKIAQENLDFDIEIDIDETIFLMNLQVIIN